ncbi:retrovirus-related pol polyprotein from transposon TNT 1-94 [Tanacetum coccineum]
MLRRKLNEIEAYNASKGRVAVKEKGEGSVNTTKEKRARCYICRKRGHVFWKCPNKKNSTTLEAPTIDNQSKEPTMVRKEERLKYPENIHVKTDYMIEGTDFSNWDNIWLKEHNMKGKLFSLTVLEKHRSNGGGQVGRNIVIPGHIWHNKCSRSSICLEEDKEGCDGETDCATSKEGNGCDVEIECMIAKHNKYLEEYIDSIDSKDASTIDMVKFCYDTTLRPWFKEEPVKCEKTKKVEGGCDHAKEENPQEHIGELGSNSDALQFASCETDEPIVKEKQSTSVDTSIPIVENTCLRSYSPIPMQRSTSGWAGNLVCRLYANLLHIPVDPIRAISERFANTAYGFFLGKLVAYLVFSSMDGLNAMLENVLAILRESSYTRAMIELQADVELKDTIVVAMLKLSGQGFYRCNVQVEYEWKPHRYACCKVFGHIQEECPKNPGLGVVKNLKKPSHSSRGVPVGPKVSFKTAKEIDLVLKKAYCQHIAMGTSNLASNGANSSGLSFWNVETSSIRTTPIVDKIRKIEKLIVDGKLTLMDNDGKPLKRFNMDKGKVVSSPLTPNFKLTDKDCPSSKNNIEKMDRVPYASAVGSLMYAMVCTRPDLAHAVGVVSRFLSNPDSDLAGNKDNMKSTSGYSMTFAGGAVSWQSRLQKCVALSTTEAEYMAAIEACKELLWLKRFLQEPDKPQYGETVISFLQILQVPPWIKRRLILIKYIQTGIFF